MPVFAIVLMATILPLIYLFIAGVWGSFFLKTHECTSWCYHDHEVSAFFAGVLWPFSIPLFGGTMVGNNIKTSEEKERERIEIENENRKRLQALELENAKLDRIIKSSDWYEDEMAKLPKKKIRPIPSYGGRSK